MNSIGSLPQSVIQYSPVVQTWIDRKEMDDQLMSWFTATATESKLTERNSVFAFTLIFPRNDLRKELKMKILFSGDFPQSFKYYLHKENEIS